MGSEDRAGSIHDVLKIVFDFSCSRTYDETIPGIAYPSSIKPQATQLGPWGSSLGAIDDFSSTVMSKESMACNQCLEKQQSRE